MFVFVFEDLAHDWLYLYHNKHSRHMLGVHSFVSLTVRLSKNLKGTKKIIVQCHRSDWPFKGLNNLLYTGQSRNSPKMK